MRLRESHFYEDGNSFSLKESTMRSGLNQAFKSYLSLVVSKLQNNGQLDSVKVESYQSVSEKLLKYMIILMHLSSGQPARATEIEQITLRNYGDFKRSLRVMGNGELLLHYQYSKNSSRSGDSKDVLRFLFKKLEKIFKIYLALIRPTLISLSQFVDKPGDTAVQKNNRKFNLETYLCVHVDGSKMTSEFISKLFGKVWKQYIGSYLTFSQNRQVQIAFMRKHLRQIVALIDDSNTYEEESDIFDTQSGHSSSIANTHYGRTEYSIGRHSDEHFHNMRECSKALWIFLELEEQSNSSLKLQKSQEFLSLQSALDASKRATSISNRMLSLAQCTF